MLIGHDHCACLAGTGAGHDPIEEPVTLAELDASVGTGPDVPENEVAVRYYSDEAFLTAIRLRRNGRSTD